MESVNPKEIKTHPTFENLFPIKPEVLAAIEQDMTQQDYGFDPSQPIILATWDGQREPVCIDGHTRLKAAINVGIEKVPVFLCEFMTEEEAMQHAIHLQCNRRNLSDGDLIKYLQVLDTRYAQERDPETGKFTGAPSGASGKSSEATAALLNTSPRKVERMRTILTHGEPDTMEAVIRNEMSVNKGYQETQGRRRAKSNPSEPKDEPVNTLEESPAQQPEPPQCEHAGEEAKGYTTVRLPESQYRALRDLGDSIEYHLELAVEMYLRMVANAMEEAC